MRRLLDVDTGDQISFNVNDHGVVMNKLVRPLTIQERFSDYDISQLNKNLKNPCKSLAQVEMLERNNYEIQSL
ncbi:hypothetical protein [Virgibacillus necropolis]|uniref:hypothetical protein n=1 Tax=Virgibacillus necropolis TaxID=163877 RepID=UPI003868671E